MDDDEPDSSPWRGGLAGGGVSARGVVDSAESTGVSLSSCSEVSCTLAGRVDIVCVSSGSLEVMSTDFFLVIIDFFNGFTTALFSACANARAWSGIIFDFIRRSPTAAGTA